MKGILKGGFYGLTMSLIMLKLVGNLDLSWWVVLIPILVPIFVVGVFIVLTLISYGFFFRALCKLKLEMDKLEEDIDKFYSNKEK